MLSDVMSGLTTLLASSGLNEDEHIQEVDYRSHFESEYLRGCKKARLTLVYSGLTEIEA